jgi:hypothetical protein
VTAPLANSDLPTQRGFYRALGWPQVVDDYDYAAFAWAGPDNTIVAAARRAARLPAS